MTLPRKAALAAPFVKEADGAFLRPDVMPLGPTVHIPRYENSAAGDRIILTWTGGASIEGHWSDELVLATADEECIFHVPFIVLSAAESYEVTTHYELRRASGTVESSTSANFSVRNYPPTGLIQTYDEDGLPTDSFKYDAEFFDAQLSDDFALSLKEGDQVIFWLRGLLGFPPSQKLAAACEHVVLTVPGPKDLPQGVNPTRHTFSKGVILANYGSELLLSCFVIRQGGYIQHADVETGLRVSQEPITLDAVAVEGLTNGMIGYDELVLDAMADPDGLSVSISRNGDMADAHVTFYLDDSSTEAFPVGAGDIVQGRISRDMLEQHVDSHCDLYCIATKGSGENEVVCGRSSRRILAIRRNADSIGLPIPDSSLAAPSIDRLSNTHLDPAQFPDGPLARIRAIKGIAMGDTVTITYRIPGNLQFWEEVIPIDDGNIDGDIVMRIPMWYITSNKNWQPALYYSVRHTTGSEVVERFSPPINPYIQRLTPRVLLHFVCALKYHAEDGEVFECPPDADLRISVDNRILQLVEGDQLILTFLGNGYTNETSMVIVEEAISGNPDFLIYPLEANRVLGSLIRANAGHTLRYRATKIRGEYIEHAPFKPLSVLPGTSDTATLRP